MRLVLVAMPWPPFDTPSPALGILSSYVRRHAATVEVLCRSEYLQVWDRFPQQYETVSRIPMLGELLYCAHLFPSNVDRIRDSAIEEYLRFSRRAALDDYHIGEGVVSATLFDDMVAATVKHVEIVSEMIADQHDLVGLTTSFNQLFASLAMARAVKSLRPSAAIILGGRGVSRNPASLLRNFPFVDYVIVGEGEQRLLRLIEAIHDKKEPEAALCDGVLFRSGVGCGGGSTHNGTSAQLEISDMDTLPVPDYDEYAALAGQMKLLWDIPVEASRGCWWDRRVATGRTTDACCFCGINWPGTYREKTEASIVDEMATLSDRYHVTRFRFMDSVLRQKGVEDLAEPLRLSDKDYRFAMEIRANATSMDLVHLFSAGCFAVQCGIEGLSNSYLKRLNKGTTTIQNLAIMKTCYELGIRNSSNLLIGFPGATECEVRETVQNILKYAIAFEPLKISRFKLDTESAVYANPQMFGVRDARNHALFRKALPPDVCQHLDLPWLDYTPIQKEADWSSVEDACVEWRAVHQRVGSSAVLRETPKPLFYLDGGTFLEVYDRRANFKTISLPQLERDVFLFCTEIRSLAQITQFAKTKGIEREELDGILDEFADHDLVFIQRGQFLTLPVAWRVDVAVERIKTLRAGGRKMSHTGQLGDGFGGL